ncbi:FecR family protein [Marinilabilia rubra]|uniref:Anti-sigma factor n=1 Tax=Marinilabilia rubra TaxID=2162893 RepID=A0A2U2B8I1_9BACT|nr:FecR domain-containing protein [Marinilabilia rubra]PWD99352.1 hypothetical protein DDZ16_10090 [Marinilabilia rubra]
MKSDFLKYNLEKLIEDKSFVDWVLKGDKNDVWNAFIEENPGFKPLVEEAREIVLLIKDDSEGLDEQSVLGIWRNIEQFDANNKRQIKKLRIRRSISWAASILLIISLGILGLYEITNEEVYHFAESELNISKDARLVLSTGEEIALTMNESSILLDQKNQQLIVNDSIIDLKSKDGHKVKMNEVIVPKGKRSELLLADGTKVWLNAGSRLAFPSKFSGKRRDVYLEGEACFKVARNKHKPFIVNAGDLDVKVLGTWFDVSAYGSDNKIETVLLEGSVAVSRPTSLGIGKKEYLLKPNQRASFHKENNIIEIEEEYNVQKVISWTKGWYEFSGENVRTILERVERYYNVRFIVPEGLVFTETISGKLDLNDSLKDVIEVLEDVAQIQCRVEGNDIYIGGGK